MNYNLNGSVTLRVVLFIEVRDGLQQFLVFNKAISLPKILQYLEINFLYTYVSILPQ
jgi:hypothetical protein